MTNRGQEEIRVEPLSAALGAVVHGVDVAALDAAGAAQVRGAWLEHKVLFFRDQTLGPADQLRFAGLFGEVEVHPYVEALEGHPGVQLLHSERGARADVWHSDATFEERPPTATILRYVSGPSRGGDTMWSDQCLAYSRCSRPLQDLLEGLTAVHTAATFGRPGVATEHPVVRVHPETDRRALYVNRQFTARIPQLDPLESAALLDHLSRWSAQPEFTCRWSWRPGDVVMWDNRSTQHYAVNDYDEPRIMQRVILAGDRPSGPPARWDHRDPSPLSASTGYHQRVALGG